MQRRCGVPRVGADRGVAGRPAAQTGGPKQRSLLAMLLLRSNEVVSWAGDDDTTETPQGANEVHAPLTLKRLEDHLGASAEPLPQQGLEPEGLHPRALLLQARADIYREETAAALAELGEIECAEELARDPAFHILQVPPGNSWEDVRGTDESLMGKALNDALAAIRRASAASGPTLTTTAQS